MRSLTDFRRSLSRVLRGAAATVLGLVIWNAPALAADAMIDAITLKWRDGVVATNALVLPDEAVLALYDALHLPFIQDGRTRDGAFHLVLPTPLGIDAARAAINRVRLLPQVLYATLNEARSSAPVASGTAVKNALAAPSVGRMIIKYRDPAVAAAADRDEALPATLLNRLSLLAGLPVAHQRAMSGGGFVVSLFQQLPLDQAKALAKYLETDPAIEYAEPDLLKQPLLVPNDPLYASQWHYQSPPSEIGGINLPPAWALTTGATGIVAAVIDTGSLPAHPDLAGRYVGGYDFISDSRIANDGNGRDNDPSDPGDWITAAEDAAGFFAGCGAGNSSYHGTHVAGTIGAASNNGMGVAGINWVSRILPLRVLGKCGGYTSDITDAIRWAAGISVPGVPANANPARVLNLSLGGYACDSGGQNCTCGTAFQSAIDAAINAGAVVVVAAGNANAPALQSSPGNCNGVITVAASGRQGQRASYSNYGAVVEIAAPGGSDGQYVLSTFNSGATSPDPAGYAYVHYQGTSMATPHVAGVVSLMLSANPSLTPAQVLAKVQTTARAFPTGTIRDCTTSLCGAGLLDAGAAVLAALGASPAATTTTLASSPSPTVVGALATFTAIASGNNPTGTVAFTDGGNSIGGCAAVPLAGSGNAKSAACSTSSLAVGNHSVVASYGGDAGNTGSSSIPLVMIIIPAPGTTLINGGFEAPTLSGNGYQYQPAASGWAFNSQAGMQRNGSVWGAPAAPEGTQTAFLQGSGAQMTQTINLAAGTYAVSFYAARRAWQGAGQPLQLSIDGIPVGTPISPTSTAFALYTSVTFTVTAGNHALQFTTINPTGDNSSFVDAVTLNALNSVAASLGSSGTPATFGSSVTFTATVTGSNPTGSVVFADGGNSIGGCAAVALNDSGSTRTAACTTSSLGVGSHSVVASYAGDANNAGVSSSPLTQVVNAAASATTLASSASPAAFGSSVAFAATVSGSNPTGSIAFTDGGNSIGGCAAVPLVGSGNAKSAACSTGSLAVGNHSVVASYGGDAGNTGSGSAALVMVIDPAPETTLVNGGFEAPTLSSNGYQYQPTTAGWVFNRQAGIQRNGSAWGAPAAPEGAQTAFLQGNGAQMAQTINLAAGTYAVSFYAARRAWQGAGQPLQLSIDGIPVGTPISPTSTAFALYTSVTFTVAAGNHALQFTTTNPTGDNSSFVDAVTLNRF